VLVPDDGASEASAFVQGSSSPHPHPPAALPTPAFVTSIASLASQTACSLGEQLGADGSSNGGSTSNGGAGLAAAASVADTLLSVCEDCVAAVVELGVGDRASDALLAICLGISRQLLPLLATEGQLDGNALADLLPRLQALLVSGGSEGREGRRTRGRVCRQQLVGNTSRADRLCHSPPRRSTLALAIAAFTLALAPPTAA
jgi:hypothetical protein